MDMESRLEDLEKEARRHLAESFAVDKMIRALIATHPDPGTLRTLFVAQMEHVSLHLADVGFDRRANSDTAKAVVSDVRRLAEAWLAVLPPSPPAG